MIEAKKTKKGKIGMVVMLLVPAIIYGTPILSSKPIVSLFAIFLYVMYIISQWMYISTGKNSKIVMNTAIFLFLIVSYRFIGISDAGWSRYILKFGFFLPVLIMLTLPDRLSDSSIKRLWWLISIATVANILYNIYLGILYPSINTEEVQEMMDESVLDNLNLGTSPYYTYSMFFGGVCFFVYLNCKQKIEKIFMLICSLVAAVYICWFCYKASVVVFTLLLAAMIYFASKTKKPSKFMVVGGIIGVIALLLVSQFSDELVRAVISFSPSERLTGRLVTLIDSQNSEAYDATLQGRENLVLLSVQTWLSSPINFLFGIGDHFVSGKSAISTGIGQHAALLDGLAQYGIIGMSFFAYSFYYSVKYCCSKFKREKHLQIMVIFFVLFLCGFAKNIFIPGIGFVLFILLPLSALYINTSSK